MRNFITLIMIAFLSVSGLENIRPEKWAKPVQLQGVENFYKITENLYRSAQPTETGMKNLEKLGIKKIINLRSFHSDKKEIKKTELSFEEISMNTWHIEDKDVIKVLRIIKNEKNGPYLIHCKHGADRTGVIIAIYRIIMQGWSKEDAINEMTKGGYGFHSVWKNIVQYVKKTEIEKLKKEIEKP